MTTVQQSRVSVSVPVPVPVPVPVSFSQMAARPPPPPPTLTVTHSHSHPGHAIPTGSWTAYFHEPEDNSWTGDSYKRLQVLHTWEELGALLRELGPHKTTNGLLRIMRGESSPLWEHRANLHGGSYCLKVTRQNSIEVFQRYLAAAALGGGCCSKNPANEIVGVTISPKKGFCIIKIWNLNSALFNSPSDLCLLHGEIKEDEIIYRKHTDQRM